jgi:hypothetical protein
MGCIQPPIQWVTGALSPGLKWPGRELNHSPPSEAEIKNVWSYTSTSQYVFIEWCLVKHRNNFSLHHESIGDGNITKHSSKDWLWDKCFEFSYYYPSCLVQCIMMNFTACILRRILLGSLNKGEWGGLDMWHAWGGERCLQGFGWEARRQETTGKT